MMDDRRENLNKPQITYIKQESIRDKIDKQQEMYIQIKEQIKIQIERCNLLLEQLN